MKLIYPIVGIVVAGAIAVGVYTVSRSTSPSGATPGTGSGGSPAAFGAKVGSGPTLAQPPIAQPEFCLTSLSPPPCDPLDGDGSTSNDLWNNALDPSALAQNQPLLNRLAANPLSASLFAGQPSSLLANLYARDLLKYIVSCALDPCDSIAFAPPPTGFPSAFLDPKSNEESTSPIVFRGEIGLCGATYASNHHTATANDNWKTPTAPSPGCLERVSACVLARVNSVGKRVPFSVRGIGLKTGTRVPVQSTYREGDGTTIASFEGCDTRCSWAGNRNCDWEPRYVGQCERGQQVKLTFTPAAVTSSEAPTPGARIRICNGINGCDNFDPGAGTPTPSPIHSTKTGVDTQLPTPYGGTILAESTSNEVKFPCPPNGPKVGALETGYYSVMLSALASGDPPLRPGDDVKLASPTPSATNSYYASEQAVFTFLEGAFYGDIFHRRRQMETPDRTKETALGGYQHACFSSNWNSAVAAAADRFCAVAGSGCFVNPPLPCDGPSGASQFSLGHYKSALGSARTWRTPYTTFLNHPCDLSRDRASCVANLANGVLAQYEYGENANTTPNR